MKNIQVIRNKMGIVKRGNKAVGFRIHGVAREIVRGIKNYETGYFLAFMSPFDVGFDNEPTIGEFYNRMIQMGMMICKKSDIFLVIQNSDYIEPFNNDRSLSLGMMPVLSSDKVNRILIFRQTDDIPIIHAVRSPDTIPLYRTYVFRVPKNHSAWFATEVLHKSE